MSALKAGDTVIVTKLDRLGRSTRELLDLIERISAAGASFKSLGDPLWDTTSSQGRSRGALQPAPDDFAMLRLILLATLPQFAGVLLMVAGRTSERRGM